MAVRSYSIRAACRQSTPYPTRLLLPHPHSNRSASPAADPTIKIFKNGKAEEYEGPRESKGIVSFVKKAVGITGGAASMTKLKTEAELKAITDGGITLLGIFREPVTASAIYRTFSEVASELPTYTDKKVTVAYSASYSTDPIATALGVKQVPALMLLSPGKEPVLMKIPRKRDEFTEDALTDWLKAALD